MKLPVKVIIGFLFQNLDSQSESELTQEFDEAQEGNRTGDYGSAKKSEPTDIKR